MYSHGFLKASLVTFDTRLGDVEYNKKNILNKLNSENKASLLVFQTMALTGYGIGDLIFKDQLYKDELKAIKEILDNNTFKGIFILGAYIKIKNNTYKCALVCEHNQILGIVPEEYFDDSNENGEGRYFSSNILDNVLDVEFLGQVVPFGLTLFTNEENDFSFGVELGQDLTSLNAAHNFLYASGAEFIICLTNFIDKVGVEDKVLNLINGITKNVKSGMFVLNNSSSETSSECIYANFKAYSENGVAIYSNNLAIKDEQTYYDIDISKIKYQREMACLDFTMVGRNDFLVESNEIYYDLKEDNEDYIFERDFDKLPFLPKLDKDYQKIIDMQAVSVKKRLDYIGIKNTVIGVSGGLDSTLAILSLAHMCDLFNLDRKSIIALTMPTNNTSGLTYDNAWKLMKGLNVTTKEINIKDQFENELKMIGHDTLTKDVTYENAQARIRTLNLMNIANKEAGIVIGTSDMSEVALGWSTFNGDQMAMYGVNAGLPKTAIKATVKYYADYIYPDLKECLYSIIDTPISPELANNQHTEDIIGKYEINDFILYHTLVNGDSDERIVYLINKTFNLSNEQAIDYINNFNKRFYHQQYKRLTMPEGVQLLDISLSPRSALKLNGDIYNKKIEK